MDYRDAEAVLQQALAFGIHPSLTGIEALCAALSRPQDAFSVIQITGTNGKTSTARLTEAILRAEGAVTALYTSPHLERYPERIEMAGTVVSDEEFARAITAVVDVAEGLRPGAQGTETGFTEFELLTAAALWLFRERGVEIAVLEVGMGGRWDATSVVVPSVAVVTGVGLDHTGVLGASIDAIAREKAAIIRPGVIPVLGPGTAGIEGPFIERAADLSDGLRAVREDGASSPATPDLTVRFTVRDHPTAPDDFTTVNVAGVLDDYAAIAIPAPAYQAGNVATAIAAAEAVLGRALDAPRLRAAVAAVGLPGRFELVQGVPPVILDGSHNPQAAEVLAGAIADAWPDSSTRPTVLLGVLQDKDAEGIVLALARLCSDIAVTAPMSLRARSAADLAAVVEAITGRTPQVFTDVTSAVDALRDSANGLVVTGSLTTVGEARRVLVDDSISHTGAHR